MKSFREFITEKKRGDYGRKGGQGGTRSTSSTPFQRGEDRARIQDTSKYQTPGRGQRPTPLTADDIYQAARPVDANVDIGKGQTWIGSSKRVIKKAKSADAAERAAKGFGNVGGRTATPADKSDYIARQRDSGGRVSAEIEGSAARGGADIEKIAGTEKPPRTKPGSYVVEPPAKRAGRQPGASGTKPTGSLRAGTLKFPGDAKYKEMLGDMPKAPTTLQNLISPPEGERARRPRIGTAGRATTQTYDVNPFSSKEFKALRYGRGRSGPSSPLRTPSQVTKFQQGIEKGYFDPKTNRLTSAGIQRYTDSRAAAGPNFAKGDPRAALANVQNIVRRAASGDKAARAEVKKTYKAATTGYKPPQGTPPAPSKPTKPPSQVIAQTQQTGRIEAKSAASPSPSKSGGGSSGPSKTGDGVITPEKVKTTLSGPLKSGPAPSAPTKKPTAAAFTPGKTKAGTGLYTPPIKATPTKVTAPAPASAPAAPAAPAKSRPARVSGPKPQRATTRTVAPKGSSNAAAASAKSFRRMARVGGLFATGLTVKSVRDQALASGAGRRRADLEGLAAGLGGSLASTAAITAATPTGPVGQAVAGTAAFQPGADFARGIVRKLAGKPGDPVTKKSVLKNIKSTYREVVPKDIRQKVPGAVKKGFTDFYNQAVPFANKLYKGYRRFERVSDLTGGDKK